MKQTTIALFLLLATTFTYSQTVLDCCDPKPFVEVTGSAEMEIVPDEIYITILLQELYDGKTKITIEKMESDMFTALKSLNIEPKNISLSDASSNYYYRWMKEDDALISRSYTVMVSNAEMVMKVYDEMGKIKATNAYISKLSHSKIEEFRMQTKVNATIAAKSKAGNMLKAIGEELGEAILIQELEEQIYQPYEYSQLSNMEVQSRGDFNIDEFQSEIGYQTITIRYEVFTRFEIL